MSTNGNSESMKRIPQDGTCITPSGEKHIADKRDRLAKGDEIYNSIYVSTSIGVDNFFSQILSYFCFFVAAFNPCHGRLYADLQFVKSEKVIFNLPKKN